MLVQAFVWAHDGVEMSVDCECEQEKCENNRHASMKCNKFWRCKTDSIYKKWMDSNCFNFTTWLDLDLGSLTYLNDQLSQV